MALSSIRLTAPDPFPDRMFRKLVFCQTLTMATGTTTAQLGVENLFRLNSLFDPDQTGGTHQPYGFDQMATLYDRYVVHAVTVDWQLSTVPFSSSGATAIFAIGGALITQPSTATYNLPGRDISDVEEKNMGTVMWLEATGRVSRFRQRFSIADLEGLTPEQLRTNVEDYSALFTTNPARSPQLRVAIANLSSSSSVTVAGRVRLEFECEFFARTTLASSN